MPPEPCSRADPTTHLRVLVVDDDADARDVIGAYLEQRRHNAVAVGTKDDGIRALAGSRFDVVVTDVLLPDGDGIDILNYILAHRLPVRVVAVTGGGQYFGPEFFRRVTEALRVRVLQKPFGYQEFIDAIEGHTDVSSAGAS